MRILVIAFAAATLSLPAFADLTHRPDDVYVRVVDTGSWLCDIVLAPGDGVMVYDGGHWTGSHCIKAARKLSPGQEVDILVVSPPDADNLGDADEILAAFDVRLIRRTGFPRFDKATWRAFNDAVGEEARFGATVANLQSFELVPGRTMPPGDATVTFFVGWGDWTESGPSDAERRIVISIVLRLDYEGGSVLFAGDTIGRRLVDDDDACKDAESFMADRHDAEEISLKADAIIAPHHSGNNGSSTCFVERVDPDAVIFSAGHDHGHPSRGVVGRYIAHNAAVDILRTDRGDDEGGFEWRDPDRVEDCEYPRGDDGVEIVIRGDGEVEVDYRQAPAPSGC